MTNPSILERTFRSGKFLFLGWTAVLLKGMSFTRWGLVSFAFDGQYLFMMLFFLHDLGWHHLFNTPEVFFFGF
jgi:hypothetical protein